MFELINNIMWVVVLFGAGVIVGTLATMWLGEKLNGPLRWR
jgi:hypothetical protein